MRTLPKRVQQSYSQLLKCRLISKKEYDDEAIQYFGKILNSAMPIREYDNIIYYFIKDLFHEDKEKFINYISGNNLQPLILYTDNINIIKHFNLQYKIYINWDSEKNIYIVAKYK